MRNFLICILLAIFTSLAYGVQAPFDVKDELLITKGVMKMAATKVLVGDSNGKAQAVTMSGDATMSNAGALTIAAGAVEESMLEVPTSDGLMAVRTARATYDIAVDGGDAAAHGLGVTLPANALILHSWFYVVTQFVDAGAGTVAIHCEDADNIYAAADITGNSAGAVVEGVQDGTAANFTGSIAAACELTATVATAAQSAGKLILFVDYVVVE